MKRAYFQAIENPSHNIKLPLNEVIGQLAFSEQGLIPVITQDVVSKEVLVGLDEQRSAGEDLAHWNNDLLVSQPKRAVGKRRH